MSTYNIEFNEITKTLRFSDIFDVLNDTLTDNDCYPDRYVPISTEIGQRTDTKCFRIIFHNHRQDSFKNMQINDRFWDQQFLPLAYHEKGCINKQEELIHYNTINTYCIDLSDGYIFKCGEKSIITMDIVAFRLKPSYCNVTVQEGPIQTHNRIHNILKYIENQLQDMLIHKPLTTDIIKNIKIDNVTIITNKGVAFSIKDIRSKKLTDKFIRICDDKVDVNNISH